MIGFRDSLRSSLLSLFNVAYNSRCSLPLLISVGFMLLDLHMRLELEIEVTSLLLYSSADVTCNYLLSRPT